MNETIPLFPGVQDIGEVWQDGAVHGHDVAHHYVCSDGGRYVGKPSTSISLLAESLADLFGERIGAPIPESRVGYCKGVKLWLSSYVEFAGHWEFTNNTCYQLENLPELGRIAALDVLICNIDRHEANVLVTTVLDGGYRCEAIDFGKGQLAMTGVFEPETRLPVNGIYKSIPKRYVFDEAMSAAKKLNQLPPDVIRRIVTGATSTAAMEDARQELYDLTAARLRQIEMLTLAFLGQLP